jgi:hypothetical protein
VDSSSVMTILPSLLIIALTLRVKSSFQRDLNVICGLIWDNFVIQL